MRSLIRLPLVLIVLLAAACADAQPPVVAGSDPATTVDGWACGIRAAPGSDAYEAGMRAADDYVGLSLDDARDKAAVDDVPLRFDGDEEAGCRKQPAPPQQGPLVRVFLSEGRVAVAAARDE